MSDSILIIDSSDDEEPPQKKFKPLEDLKEENDSGLLILQVVSLVKPGVIEIDSDNETEKIKVKDEKSENNNIEQECDDINEISSVSGHDSDSRDSVIVVKSSISTPAESQKTVNSQNEIGDTETNGECSNGHENENEEHSNEDSEIYKEFISFLDLCLNSVQKVKHKNLVSQKIERLKEHYKNVAAGYINSKHFIQLIKENTERMKINPNGALIYFKTVYEEISSRKEQNLELTEKQEIFLSKLRTTLAKLHKKILKLQEREVDFNDDNDSAYIMEDRYKRKLVQVYKKYCEYAKEDSFAGRIMHRKLDFCSSEHLEINRALDKLYLKIKRCPSYSEVDLCIRKCVKDKELPLSDKLLELEIKNMHQEIGKLVQRRRKVDIEDSYINYLGSSTDPAEENQELQSILDDQRKKGEEKLNQLFDTFTKKQLQGDEPDAISSDSDDSSLVDEEEDENQNPEENT